jgi:BatD DUF11 like domain
MRIFTLLITLLTFSIFTPINIIKAQSVSVAISPKSGSIEDVFNLQIIVKDSQTDAGEIPQVSSNQDFSVQYVGPSSSIQIINGVTKSEITFNFSLTPKRLGELKTPKINFLGKSLDEVSVKVGKESAKLTKSSEVFIKQIVEPKKVFIGQQVINTVKIGSRIPLHNAKLGDLMSDGFWLVSFGGENTSIEKHYGRSFEVSTLKQALFPLKTGELKIKSRELSTFIRLKALNRSYDPFDPFSFSINSFFNTGKLEKLLLKSDEVVVKVSPLPTPTNDNFNGISLVGLTDLKLDKTEINSDENSFNFKITLISDGNLDTVKELKLNESKGLFIYPLKTKVERIENLGRLFTQKIYEYTVIPSESGVFYLNIPEVQFFNPQVQSYKRCGGQRVKITINGNFKQKAVQKTSEKMLVQERVDYLSAEKVTFFESISAKAILLICFIALIVAISTICSFKIRRSTLKKASLLNQIEAIATLEEFRDFMDEKITNLLEKVLDKRGDKKKFSEITLEDKIKKLREVNLSVEADDLCDLKADLDETLYSTSSKIDLSEFKSRLKNALKTLQKE